MMLTDSMLDIDQFLNTDLFQSQSPPSPASSPEQGLLTPPQHVPAPSFHDASDGGLPQQFSLFDDEIKTMDGLGSASPFDFLNAAGGSLDQTMSGYSMDLGYSGIPGFNMNMNMGLGFPDDALQHMSIDPQLVDTPTSTAPISDFDDQDGDDEQSQPTSSATSPDAAAPSPTAVASSSSAVPGAGSEKDQAARERLTLTIAPIKVGGHGKARRGTVQSGGISKKSAAGTTSLSALHHHNLRGDQDNHIDHRALVPPPTDPPSPTPSLPEPSTTKTLPKPPTILKASSASKKGKDKVKEIEEDDDDDVPQDWRPSPEVFAKMTSKEKRQLRNKISARNFRVRRKEYISTLEGDIADRDRLLDAIRSELGSTQSENLALRQEIATLKKVLLDGRGGAGSLPSLNLPPPAPLPVGLGAPTAATLGEGMVPSPPGTPAPASAAAGHQQATATVSTSAPSAAPSTSTFAAPNIQKDLPSSPTPRPFWGGQHLGGLGNGGVTPVHTTLIPEINVSLWGSVAGPAANVNGVERPSAGGKNINPLLNAIGAGVTGVAAVRAKESREEKEKLVPMPVISGFDAFADANLFTMKSLDAYRMQLWGKMAAQHHAHNNLLAQQATQAHALAQAHHPSSQLTGAASQLRPAYFSTPSLSPKSSSATTSSTNSGLGATLSSLLSGKHTTAMSSHGLLTPPGSPRLGGRGTNSSSMATGQKEKENAQREREAQAAMLAAVASQTLFKKLGNAFWDAFSGNSPSPSNNNTLGASSAASTSTSTLGAGRNWDADKVRKVLEGKAVVKVVDIDSPPTSSSGSSMCGDVKRCASDILEESMRSLTLSRKASSSGGLGREK